ncbi:integrase arm-type DNA-binding domain-containing protein [Rhizorhabdus wittichii]|uniref:Integrase arm-type DNA-binding domain-containing protein n=1 Tax=Rhizorhabdus wittichii TaxID=160791 RepID=A0A975D540_9SPHN|nr:integrase arm-type DNA-binding domain-containing protein [Rhizorhabdus wittichii]QTH23076.1 integrase arm-type DNA-binding domain-containing protein [Rhizorhabdus wittichii]
MPLTETQAKNAKPRERAYKLADSEGLFLLVQPNGTKLWRMKYRVAGKEKLLSFGAYPALGIAAARDKRKAAKALLAEGKDPMKAKGEVISENGDTFYMVAKRWHENRQSALNPAHAERVWSRMERDVFPSLGQKLIHEITAPEVLDMIRRIETRGALDISRRAKQGVGQVFQFAIACGLASSDPTAHLSGALKPRPRVKHMSRLPLVEIPAFLEKLRAYQEEGDRRSAITRDAVLFALLTWVRTKELRLAVKSEFENIDGTEPVWRIPAARMKMGREHLVPLSAQAALLARKMVSTATGDYLFPGTHPDKPLSENTMIYALYRLGYHSRQTIHGFRGLASTWANEQLVEFGKPAMWIRKYHEDWVEMQLAHSEKNDVRGAYNAAEYLTPRRRMMQDWADFLDGRKVVDIKKGRKRAA